MVNKCSHGAEKQNKFRMYSDFKDVKKSWPNESFPVPNIDQMINAIVGHEIISFLDAYSWYNLIQMDPRDQEKTSFVTNYGIYCYNVMSFGLKNDDQPTNNS